MCEYISHTMVAVCVNVILLSICPSSNLKMRAYEKEISEVLWTKRIEQLKWEGGKHKPEETRGPSHPSEDIDLIKMAAEGWHDGQHWLKALGCMTRENPECVCVSLWENPAFISFTFPLNLSLTLWTSLRLSDPRTLNTWIGSVDESPHTYNKSG